MNILVITPNYPTKNRSVYTFVKQLVDQFAYLGHRVCVISPFSVIKNKETYPFKDDYKVSNGNEVVVLRPNHISFSNVNIGRYYISDIFRKIALNRALKRLPFVPDVVYGHFWRSGREIFNYAKVNNLPLFIASGESVISQDDISPRYRDFYNYVRGVICVSTKNKDESVSNGLTLSDKCIVAPNAINPHIFYKKNRKECRARLGIDSEIFIVAMCGALCHRKGVKVLSDALDSIEGEPVYSMFIGRPMDELPSCKNIIFQGPVEHEMIVDYLNAADVFVLPTLNEGCCNAIIEAMACGLPVISSDRLFNKDVLTEDNSILIEPTNHLEVANAIKRLRDDLELRSFLSKGAIKTARQLTIQERAKKIIDFINDRIKYYS